MHRWLIATLLLCVAPIAEAMPFTLVFDGTVSFTIGSSPSLAALGLMGGSALHYEVLVDRDADGFLLSGGEVIPQPDLWIAADDHEDRFYAELLAQAYPTPGSFLDLGREFFVGADVISPAFPECAVLGRLFVGTEQFVIDGCAAVTDWSVGFEVGSGHSWNDPTTGEAASVFANLTVTQVIPIAEPGAACLLALGLGLLGAAQRANPG